MQDCMWEPHFMPCIEALDIDDFTKLPILGHQPGELFFNAFQSYPESNSRYFFTFQPYTSANLSKSKKSTL